MVDITIRIDTDLSGEADDLLDQIKTTIYKEVGGGKVTIYPEWDTDIEHIQEDVKAILDSIEHIKEELESQEERWGTWEAERRAANAEYERSVL